MVVESMLPRLLRAAVCVCALMLAIPAFASAAVSVFPLPGSKYNMPASQIAFRGVSPGQLGTVTVTGSKSGTHTGRIEADSDGQGASFLPAKPFTAGETVTVKTSLDLVGASGGTFKFTIAHPAAPIASAPLPQVPAGAHGLQHFHSAPGLVPPSITVAHKGATSSGDIFVAPQFGPSQDGPMILDPWGNLVWFDPTPISHRLLTTDLRVQSLAGKPVLTWWQGNMNSGSGRGEGVIAGSDYRVQKIVHAANGMSMDLHEFLVTPQGQAYFLVASPVHLPGYGRPVIDSVVQEVDIATGLVLFEWHALDHIALSESDLFGPNQPGHILDPYHLNSIALDHDGNLILSARNTSAIYKVNHSTGAIIWRLGGKRSSFKMGPGTTTAFQHDAVVQPDGTLTIFDDGAGPPKVHSQSRGIRVALNLKSMTATLVSSENHSPSLVANFEGSAQVLPNSDVFLGWGQQPYFSEYSRSGRQVFDARFTAPTSSYRAYRFQWTGHPTTKPALALSALSDGTVNAYESWNGATDVTGWRVLAGPSASALAPVRAARKYKFESTLPVHSGQSAFQVQALGAGGKVLAASGVVTAPARLAIYGQSAFVPSTNALGGIPASCLASRACSVQASVWSGRTLLARSGRQHIPAGGGGIVFFRLSPAARGMLARAPGNRLPVELTLADSSGLRATSRINLIAFRTSGRSPSRSTGSSADLRTVGTTDFVSSRGVGGILASCNSTRTCNVKLSLSAGGTTIATTGNETIGAGELGYVMFKLTGTGQSMLARARGSQLGVQARLSDSRGTATANLVLVPFR